MAHEPILKPLSQKLYQYKSRSYVIELALRLLQEKDLEDAYRQANAEIDAEWEVTSVDGLSDETW